MTEIDEFEHWAKSQDFFFQSNESPFRKSGYSGQYKDVAIAAAWQTWQAFGGKKNLVALPVDIGALIPIVYLWL